MRGSATTESGGLSGSLRTLFEVGTLSGLTDGQLLERFVRGRSAGGAEAEAAFAAMVERHGAMVLTVCRAILGDRHDAEDACQATFLVLARRAGTIRRGDSLASWLYGASRRIASRARRDLARRRELERRRLERIGNPSEPTAPPLAEPIPELYEELDRLPEPFRAAVVLCDLEGHPYDRAAGLLGCPIGTLQSRLARGRERLRVRLERRGIGPAMMAIAPGAGLPPSSATAIVRASVSIGTSRTIAATAPAAVAAMAGAEIRRQVMKRLATTLAMLLMAGITTTAAVGLATIGRGDDPGAARPPVRTPRPDPATIHVRVVDVDGKAVAGIAVEVRGGDRPTSFPTDADGRAVIPRDLVGEGGFLIARRGEAIAWGWRWMIGQRFGQSAGTIDNPITMRLLPLDHRVSGSIVDPAGRPLADIRVRAFQLNEPINGTILLREGANLDDLLGAIVTDLSGRFTIRLPRDARARLHPSHPRYVGPYINVKRDDHVLKTTTLEPAGGIAGRVVDAATGRPIAGAVVGAGMAELQARRLSGGGDAITDAHGRFLVGGLEPGVYNLMLRRVPGRPHATAAAVECLRVRPGSDSPADLIAVEGRPLRGIVVDRDTGVPVPGTEVGCYGPARPRSASEVEAHKTDDRGRFTFHVPPGEQHVYCMSGYGNSRLDHRNVLVPEQGEVEPIRLLMKAQGFMTPTPPAEMKVAVATKKAAPPGDAPVVAKAAEQAKAPPAAPKVRTVSGHVRDPRGHPLAGVQIQVSRKFLIPNDLPRALPKTDRDGLFLFPGLPRRPLEISLSCHGYRFQQENLPADRDEVDWTFALVPDPRESAPARDEPIPPDLRGRLTFVDLDPRGTDYLADGPGNNGNDLNRLPRGTHKLGATFFRIGEKMVHLKGRERPDLPRSVKGIEVHARGRVLHFLHSTQWGVDDGKIVAAYVVRYADGSHEQAPVVYSRDITVWWHRDRGQSSSRARPAWTGLNDMIAGHIPPGLMIRLFEMSWTNPHPDKEIATLDVLSAGKECDPFLVAVTVERSR